MWDRYHKQEWSCTTWLITITGYGKGNCEVDCEIDYEAEIYVIGGYDRLINKLRAKFVNMVSDEKGYKGFVGKERVFILTGYVSHADIYKIESLGIEGMFVNSKG